MEKLLKSFSRKIYWKEIEHVELRNHLFNLRDNKKYYYLSFVSLSLHDCLINSRRSWEVHIARN